MQFENATILGFKLLMRLSLGRGAGKYCTSVVEAYERYWQ